MTGLRENENNDDVVVSQSGRTTSVVLISTVAAAKMCSCCGAAQRPTDRATKGEARMTASWSCGILSGVHKSCRTCSALHIFLTFSSSPYSVRTWWSFLFSPLLSLNVFLYLLLSLFLSTSALFLTGVIASFADELTPST